VESIMNTFSTFKENNRWIMENYDKLTAKFKDEWVAVMNRAVLDHDKDLKNMIDRLKAQHLKDYKQIAVEYLSNDEIETVLPDNLWE
jgi:hypothetical protein